MAEAAAAAEAADWASLCETFRSALSLSYVESKKDPDAEPYRSKYSARELLQGLKQLLGAGEAGDAEGVARGAGEEEEEEEERRRRRRRAVRLAVVEYELGVNHTDTQECSAGEEHLAKCLQLLERHRLCRECVSLYIQAQNNLGILWSERNDIKTAQTYLESAEALYNQYMKENGNPPLDSSEHFMTEETLSDQERSKRFEKVYTHTLYYLAQVYQHLEMIEKAAQYCHTTLKRQLDYSGYYPIEWALNAATLSQYYLTKQCFMESRHCLAAASVIFGQAGQVPSAEDNESEQDQQDLQQRKAEIARCWIKYCLNLLQGARKLLEELLKQAGTCGSDVNRMPILPIALKKRDHVLPLQKRMQRSSLRKTPRERYFKTNPVLCHFLEMKMDLATKPILILRQDRALMMIRKSLARLT